MKRWVLPGGVALLFLVYLLRWPLFGGLVLQRVPENIHVQEWGGSILGSIRARHVEIEGYGTIDRIEATYSLFDLENTLEVTITGARIRLPKSETPATLAEQVHQALRTLRSLEIPGRVRLRRSTIEGFDITSAVISGSWSAHGSAGPLHFEASKRPDGTLRAWVQTEGNLEYVTATIDPDDTLHARASRPPYLLQFEGRLEGSRLDGNARLNSEFVAAARLDLNAETIRVDASGTAPVQGIGTVSVDAAITGSLREPPTRWHAEQVRMVGRDIRIANVALDLVRIEGRGSIESGFPLTVLAREGKDQLEAAGHLQSLESIDLAATLKIEDVGRYVDRVRGPLGAEAYLRRRGSLTEVRIDPCVLPLKDPILIRGRATHDGEIWKLHTLQARHGNESLTLSGTYKDPKNFALDLDLDGAVMLDAQAMRTPDRLVTSGKARYGEASMDFSAQARALRNFWTINLAPTEIRLPGRRIEIPRPVVILAGPKAVSLSPTILKMDAPNVRARVHGSWADGIRIEADQLHVAGHDLPPLFAQVGPEIVDIRWGEFVQAVGTPNNWSLHFEIKDLARFFPIRGEVSGDARVIGSAVEGRLGLKNISLMGEEPFTLTIPVRTKGGRIEVESSRAITALGPLTIGGPLTDLSATLVVHKWEAVLRRVPEDVRPWIPLTPVWFTVHVVDGTPHAHVSMPSDYRFPRLLGTLSNFESTFELQGSELIVHKIDGRLEGGPFHIEGRVSMESAHLTVTGQNVLVYQSDSVRVRVSPNVTVGTMEDGRFLVRGQAEIPFALYYQAFRPAASGPTREITIAGLRLEPHPDGGRRIPGIEGLDRFVLNVAVTTPGEVRIENNTVGMLLSGDVWLRGTAADPSLSGVVTARDGEIRLMTGMFLEFRNARVVLPAEPAVPAIVDFEGRVGSGENAITVRVAGRLESPKLSLTSGTARSQQELLSQLAFNRLPGAVGQAETLGVLGSQVAGELLRRYIDDWPRADRDRGFFEQWRFSVRQEEQLNTRVPPWQLPPLSSARGTVLQTEFVITRSLSIVVESNVEGNFSGDVKYRFRF